MSARWLAAVFTGLADAPWPSRAQRSSVPSGCLQWSLVINLEMVDNLHFAAMSDNEGGSVGGSSQSAGAIVHVVVKTKILRVPACCVDAGPFGRQMAEEVRPGSINRHGNAVAST